MNKNFQLNLHSFKVSKITEEIILKVGKFIILNWSGEEINKNNENVRLKM